jgi:WD40 repeat protein
MLILQTTPGKVHALAFSSDGRTLAAVSGRSKAVWRWDLLRGQPHAPLLGHTHPVVTLAFAPDEPQRLASASGWNEVFFWQDDRQVPRRVYQRQWMISGVPGWPTRLVFAADGQQLAQTRSTTFPMGVSLWTREPGAWQEHPLRSMEGRRMYALAYAPDSRLLAIGGRENQVILWDLARHEEQGVLNHSANVHFLAFAPDGRTLTSASATGMIKIWDAATGRKRTTLKGQGKFLHALCYAPDSRTLATASGDGLVRMWDVATGRSRTVFDWRIGELHAVAFAPDGMRAAAGGEGQIVVWDIDDWSP